MSLATDSPAHSASSDDFAAFLDAELDNVSDASADLVEVSEEEESDRDGTDSDLDLKRVKRCKVEVQEDVIDLESSKSPGVAVSTSDLSAENNVCLHPGHYGGLCYNCGKKVDDASGVAFGYIKQNFRLANDTVARLRDEELNNLLHREKLCLVLDLDHTLLNSARLPDITAEEGYLTTEIDSFPDTFKNSLFRVDRMHMMTKLRPFVHTFLEQASKLFEMYIYTMGERPYALEMAKLLDPNDVYFSSRVIAQGDCTTKHQKGLDVVLGNDRAVLILDDTEAVWSKHKDNLILMERYHFFASNCRHFGFNRASLSQLRSDESETEGALATVLKILQQIHSLFFDKECTDNLVNRDARQVLKTVRREVLKDCVVVFSRVFPVNYPPEHHHLWKLAEQLGATCLTKLDPSVTHVVSLDPGTDKCRWAVKENKFLVNPGWIEASNYMWQKQPEEKFPVSQPKSK